MTESILKEKTTFLLEIPADENNLSEVRDFIADICTRAGFSKRETNNTKLAMDEACTNIIKHAYRDVAGEIRIEVSAEPGKIEINVFDRGRAFEWSDVKDPDLQRYVEIGKKGGLGIYLMNRLMDDLDYKSSDEGNRLFMAKSSDAGLGMSQWPLFSSIKPKWTSTLRFKFALRAGMGLFSLVLFLWIVQFVNQGREVDSQRGQAWHAVSNLARGLESKSEKAMILDDLYDPEYREINDYIQDRIVKLPEISYVRIINNDGLIVSSSIMDEFQQMYDMKADRRTISNDGRWFSTSGPGASEDIEEFHYPVMLFDETTDHPVNLGRIILGVSRIAIERDINDPRPRTTMILAGILFVGLALIYLLISVFIKPIQDLTDGVRAIGEGALEDGIQIEGPEEIGAIASAFNEITTKFRDAQKNVVEQERMQKEMQVAQEIQHSLLPGKVPDIKGYDIASLYRAAKEVGGDYYDFVKVDEDSLGVVVADVSGKGVPGSLVMTMIRTALRMEARGSLSAAEVMSRMNDFVTEDMKKGMFVTIFYLILDSKNRIISYASAGHNPMILFRAETDETFFLNPRGFPVGISLPDDTLFRRSIDVEKIKLKKDDMLLIYTDGVTEAMNSDREQYGEDRLLSLIRDNGRNTPDEFMDRLNEDIREFTGEFPQNDDITVVAIKEKMMADDVLSGIRKKLLDLVDVDGLSVAEACSRMKVSPSTFYRYRKRLAEMGERGLKNKTLREAHEIRRVSTEQRKALLEIIRENPRFGAKRIAALYNDGKDDQIILTPSLVYEELKRMRLNTYEKRLEYLRRNRFISEEEYQKLLSGKPVSESIVSVKEEPGSAEEQETIDDMAPDKESAILEPVLEEQEDPVSVIPSEPDGYMDEGISDEPEEAGETSSVVSSDIPDFSEEGDERKEIEKILSDILAPDEGEGSVVKIELEEYRDGIIVLSVTGHLDSSSASDLENVIENVFEYGCSKIIVDLAEVSYISSGGWGIFTGRVKLLRDNGGDVVLAGMSPEVFDIYDLLGFQDIIMHCQTIGEAVDFISLPFDERQRKLRAAAPGAEDSDKMEIKVSSTGMDFGEDETSPWTPLTVEAGTVGEAGEITVLSLNGVIDTVSCLKLRGIMSELISRGAYKLLVDMSRVEYVSSAGWGVFAARIDDLRGWGGDIKIFGMDPEVDSIFHLLGFDVIMRSFSIMAEAIEDFSEPVGSWMKTGPAFPDAVDNLSEVVENSHDLPDEDNIDTALRLAISRKESPEGNSIILSLGGAIDAATTSKFEVYLESSISENPKYFIIDLSEVIYISSSGWGVIIKYMQKVTGRSGKIALCGMTPAIYKIFRDLGFEPLVPNYIDVSKAIAELSAPAVDKGEYDSNSDEVVIDRRSQKQEITGTENESAAQESHIEPGEVGFEDLPEVGSPAVKPLKIGHEEKLAELEVELDLENGSDKSKDKDKSIRSMGWKEYGRKLSRRNSKNKKG